jgi:hypothetical protein
MGRWRIPLWFCGDTSDIRKPYYMRKARSPGHASFTPLLPQSTVTDMQLPVAAHEISAL